MKVKHPLLTVRKALLATAVVSMTLSSISPRLVSATTVVAPARQSSGTKVTGTSGSMTLTAPDGWEPVENKEVEVLLVHEASSMYFVVGSAPGVDDENYDALIKGVLSGAGPAFEKGKISKKRALTIGSGIKGRVVDVDVTNGGQKLLMRVAVFQKSGNAFVMFYGGPVAAWKTGEADVNSILASIAVSDSIHGYERSKTLVLSGARPEPRFMDPTQAGGSADSYPGMLFSGLTRLTPQLQIAPDLAESWEVSADGRVYTFKLRANVAFADRQKITAEDVRYSWEHAADPKTKSDSASTYLGDIDGYKAFASGKAKTLSGLKVIDARTLQVTLDAPKAYFLAKLTFPTAFVYDKRDVKRDPKAWALQPNASGPFRIKQYEEDRFIVFEPNPAYYQQAKIKNILFLIRPGGSELSLYQAGGIDMVGLSVQEAAAISAEDHPQHAELTTSANLCTTLMQFDVTKAPLDDIEVRRALIQSIDFSQIEKIREFEYPDTETWSVLPAGFPGYIERERALKFDPAAAKAALARSKYAGKLPKIVYTTRNSNNRDDTLTPALVGMWQKALGIKVEVEYREPENFVLEARKKHGNIVPFGWCADYPDPENFLDVLFHSDAGYNVAAMKDKELDTLLETARSEQDPAKRIALYQKAESRIHDQALAFVYPRIDGHGLVKPYLKGYVPTGIGVQQFHLLSIDGFTAPE